MKFSNDVEKYEIDVNKMFQNNPLFLTVQKCSIKYWLISYSEMTSQLTSSLFLLSISAPFSARNFTTSRLPLCWTAQWSGVSCGISLKKYCFYLSFEYLNLSQYTYDEGSLCIGIQPFPRPFLPLVFGCLLYTNTEGEGLGDLVTCGDVRQTEGRHTGGGA